MRQARRIAGVIALAALVAVPAVESQADSFAPVRLAIRVSALARLHAPLPVSVRVSADPGALDDRNGALRVEVKLAAECGGTYQYTAGPVLLNRRLHPQPTTGHPYSAVARGAGRPTSYGAQTACTWLVDEGDGRVWASDQSVQVVVSRSCTTAAARYEKARRHHKRTSLARLRRAARKACGRGVKL